MADKRLTDAFSKMIDQELQFNKEDRQAVFEQIHQLEKGPSKQKKARISLKKLAPVTVSFFVVGLVLFLLMPSLLLNNVPNESNSDFAKQPHIGAVSDPAKEKAQYSTTLITVKSKEMDNRIYLNLLFTYNKEKEMMKVVSLPSGTHVQVANNPDGTAVNDKLLVAYQFGGAENVAAAVSTLISLPIDYHAVIDLETVSTLIDAMNGLHYDLQEDLRARAILQVAFEFEQGANQLNGEQVMSLMMAATEGNSLDEADLANLIHAVINKTKAEIPPSQLKELFTQVEANVPLDYLLENKLAIHSLQAISISEGMIPDTIILSKTTGKHFYRFEKDFLHAVSEELTSFN